MRWAAFLVDLSEDLVDPSQSLYDDGTKSFLTFSGPE